MDDDLINWGSAGYNYTKSTGKSKISGESASARHYNYSLPPSVSRWPKFFGIYIQA